jgi:hypothetical protein
MGNSALLGGRSGPMVRESVNDTGRGASGGEFGIGACAKELKPFSILPGEADG